MTASNDVPGKEVMSTQQRMAKFYNTSLEYTAHLDVKGDEYFSEAAAFAADWLPKDGPVLEIGAGTGSLGYLLHKHGCRVIGSDLSSQFCQQAVRRFPDRAVPFLAADACRLPFAQNSLAGIVSHQVVEHLPNVKGAIFEMSRVVRPGGVIVIIVPNLLSPMLGLHRWRRLQLQRNADSLPRGIIPVGGRNRADALRIAVRNFVWLHADWFSGQPVIRYREPCLVAEPGIDWNHPDVSDIDSSWWANAITLRRILIQSGCRVRTVLSPRYIQLSRLPRSLHPLARWLWPYIGAVSIVAVKDAT